MAWLLLALSLGACGESSPVALEDKVAALWRQPLRSEWSRLDVEQSISSCDGDVLADLVILVLTSPGSTPELAGFVRDAVAARDPEGASEVWGVWRRLVDVAEMEVSEGYPEVVKEMLKTSDPLQLLKVMRSLPAFGDSYDEARQTALRTASRVAVGLADGVVVVPPEDGGFTVVIFIPCILRVRIALMELCRTRGR